MESTNNIFILKKVKITVLLILITVSCQTNLTDVGITENTSLEEDYKTLTTLYHEITTIANSISCTNSRDWNYVAYGSKACGGPQGYIAYSNKINVGRFLIKVANYTKLESQYNEKWSVFSTCDIPTEPTVIVCDNGVPTFVY